MEDKQPGLYWKSPFYGRVKGSKGLQDIIKMYLSNLRMYILSLPDYSEG